MLSHGNILSSALSAGATAETVTRSGRLLHAARMFHLADIGILAIGLLVGSTHVVVPMFTPAWVAAAVDEHDVTDALLVPTMIQMLADSPDCAGYDLSSFRRVIYGASPISQGVLDRARALLPSAELIQAYGMTELSPIATMLLPADHDDPGLARSGGRDGVQVDVRIVDPLGNEVPRDTVGEITVRGDDVMLGYWGKPVETAAVLRDDWMHTGDLARMDKSGYVYIVDRLKDMIITGGENEYPAEVENVLAKHPAVAMSP